MNKLIYIQGVLNIDISDFFQSDQIIWDPRETESFTDKSYQMLSHVEIEKKKIQRFKANKRP